MFKRIPVSAKLALGVACCALLSCSNPVPAEPAEVEQETVDEPPPLEACTHVVAAGAAERDLESRPDDVVTNRVAVSGSIITWNGAALDAVTLRQYLDIVSTMAPQPRLVVEIAPDAQPQTAALVQTTIDNSLRCDSRAAFPQPSGPR